MDPISVADIVLKIGRGVVAVLLFSAMLGVSMIPIKKSRNFPKQCVASSYEDFFIVASIFVCTAAISVVCAYIIKRIYKRATDLNPEANLVVARRLICALIPSALISYILAFVLFVMVNQYRLGKVACWSLVVKIFIFGACFTAGIVGFIICMIGYYYGRGMVLNIISLDAAAATVEASTRGEAATRGPADDA